ncbi:nucleotidyltransferase domain-containing protein [Kitasatospora purpeofusca]|uniref:nucleotidyltransferase domain-containing protein n=1 Tax=Kitasatospora purpeofusca TaxID=67352 RepID=UPI0004BFF75D|nr:nucleotidyltransferase domain-containing protein [Kitasatospora purpeofusca]
MTVHPLVHEIADAYLTLVDAAVPGLVEGLYVVGSAALGDFHPARSDIDFVAVSADPVTAAQLAGLERAHARLATRYPCPAFDGPYLTWHELAGAPAQAAPGPQVFGGTVRHRVRTDRTPVLWHTLARHGVTLCGPRAQELMIDTGPGELAVWTAGSLEEYWRPWRRRSSRLASRPGLALLNGAGAAHGVLGVSRAHYTLATGRIASKRGAGEYARAVFDERWYRILDECLRIRDGGRRRSRYPTPFARRADALAFMDMAIESAQRLSAGRLPLGE